MIKECFVQPVIVAILYNELIEARKNYILNKLMIMFHNKNNISN